MIRAATVLVSRVITHERYPVVKIIGRGHMDIIFSPIHPIRTIHFYCHKATIGLGLHLHTRTSTNIYVTSMSYPMKSQAIKRYHKYNSPG
jgi:hypothetical protein